MGFMPSPPAFKHCTTTRFKDNPRRSERVGGGLFLTPRSWEIQELLAGSETAGWLSNSFCSLTIWAAASVACTSGSKGSQSFEAGDLEGRECGSLHEPEENERIVTSHLRVG